MEIHGVPGGESGLNGLERPQDKGCIGKSCPELTVQIAERVERDLVGQQAEKVTESGAVSAVEINGGESCFAARIGTMGDGFRGGEQVGISRQPACGGCRTFLAGVKWGGVGNARWCYPGAGRAPLSVSLVCVVLVIGTWARSRADEEKIRLAAKKSGGRECARAAPCGRRGPRFIPAGDLPQS